MSVSLDNLKNLLQKKNLEPQRYFELYERCAFIEVIDTTNGNTYMFYIPSKYELLINNKDVYNITPLDVSSSDLDNYTGNYSYSNIDDMYDSLEVNVNDNSKIFDQIVDNYRKTIDVDTKKNIEYEDLISLYRQMIRLKYCVQNIKYKFVIFYKNYMCVLHIGDDIECFKIKHTQFEKNRKLLILIDLELFYENMETLDEDLQQVSKGIKNILDKNHTSHSDYISDMIKKNNEMTIINQKILDKKLKLREYITSFQNLLDRLVDSENDIIDDYSVKSKQYDRSTLNGDIQFSALRSKTENELKEIDNVKNQITFNIKRLQDKEDNLSLIVDIIFFDNTVMLNKIFNNIKQLSKIIK